MKVFITFCAIFVVVNSFNIRDEWHQFKSDHGKFYKSNLDEEKHFKTFQANLQKFAEHNKKYEAGEVSWFMAVNKFADMTPDEIAEYNHWNEMRRPTYDNVTLFEPILGDVPGTFDWRDRNGVNPVKDQGQCGSCWAFSTIGSLESRYFIVHAQTRVSLSEQQLVDCSRDFGSSGCSGGWPTEGYNYIFNNDINRDSDYPYVAREQICRADGNKNVNVHLTGILTTPQDDEETLRFAVFQQGAMAVAIHATDNFAHYGGGIFDDSTCNKDSLNHGVTVVGYGRENNQDYWAVRNSWGSNWGEGGYIKMIRKKNGQCGIARACFSPILG